MNGSMKWYLASLNLYCVLVHICLHLCSFLSLGEETHIILQFRVHFGTAVYVLVLSGCGFHEA